MGRPDLEELGLTREQGQIEVASREGGTEVVCHVISRAAENVAAFALMIDPIRKVARQLGYAIGVHGSLAKDIDLIAAPWTEEAVEAIVLIKAIQHIVKAFTAGAWGQFSHDAMPQAKPHGRLAWSINFWGGFFDISVMPLGRKDEADHEAD